MVSDYWLRRVRIARLSRRRLLSGATAAGIAVAAASAAGCSRSKNSDTGAKSTGPGASSGQATASAAQPKPGGTLTWQQGGPPPTLDDFAVGGTALPSRLSGYAYSALLAFRHGQPSFGPVDVSVEPELAASMPEQPDPLTYVVKLRAAKFHNGRSVTSEDVKYAYDRAANAAPFKQSRSWYDRTETPDPQTAVIKTKFPFADTLQTMAAATNDGFIVPREHAEGPDAATKQMGSGPYIFQDFRPDVGLSWKRNPDYYGKPAPYFDEVKCIITPDPNKRVSDFSSRQIGYTWWFTPLDTGTLRRNRPDAKFELIDNPAYFLFTRADRPPFNDKRVRQALSMSINRKAIRDATSEGKGEDDQALFIGNTYWGARKVKDLGAAAKYWNYDPQMAKQLLKAAGYENLEFTFNHADASIFGQDYLDRVTLTVTQLKEAGITAKPNQQVRNTFIGTTAIGNYEGIGINGRLPSTVMSSYLTDYMYTSPAGERSPQNAGYINDPQLNAALEKQGGQLNLEERKATLRQIEDIMAEGQWYIIYSTYPIAYFWDPSVANVRPVIFTGNMQYAARRWWLEKA